MSTRDFVIHGTKSRFGNVTIVKDNTHVGVKLHSTIVARMNLVTKTIQLNSGGWDTVTTRSAMNRALDQFYPDRYWGVWALSGEMFLCLKGVRVMPFVDGMTFNPEDPHLIEIASKGGIL